MRVRACHTTLSAGPRTNGAASFPTPSAAGIGRRDGCARTASVPAGHSLVDVGYGQLESGAWYLVRWPDRRYSLHQIAAAFPHPLVSTRSICRSPFPGDGGAIYFAGYDANKAPAHNTAWIVRTSLAAALGPQR